MPMAAKPAADHTAFQQLKKDLSAGTLGRLYVFHGEEAYLRDYYLGDMKKKLLSGGMEAFNLHTLQAKECDPKALREKIDCLPMMGERTLILVSDYDLFKANAGDKDAYTELFGDLPDYVCLVFVYDLIEYKPDARTKLA
ncbi:MAG: DNA polymerase III subunit delta, partial [Clostridia bacterium]|nr:DNA polymerase III subunit delta [Clostridia bacterium]